MSKRNLTPGVLRALADQRDGEAGDRAVHHAAEVDVHRALVPGVEDRRRVAFGDRVLAHAGVVHGGGAGRLDLRARAGDVARGALLVLHAAAERGQRHRQRVEHARERAPGSPKAYTPKS